MAVCGIVNEPQGPEAAVPEFVEDREAVGNALAEMDRAEATLVVFLELLGLIADVEGPVVWQHDG